MTTAQAVERFVSDGSVMGMGGQSIGRCPMALTLEIVRQDVRDLTVVGCNLSISMDLLVGAGLVERTECGTGNLERYGTAFRWRAAAEAAEITVGDYSHLAMASRFLAGSLGLPFMPTKSLLGSDILATKVAGGPNAEVAVIEDPFSESRAPVVLLPSLQPDVSIVHVQRADALGNFSIAGFATHEPEMVRASRAVIVSCEELVGPDYFRERPSECSVPYIFVDAVTVQPLGGYPTSVYGFYEHDAEHIARYQKLARQGGQEYADYLRTAAGDAGDFESFLERSLSPEARAGLVSQMAQVI